MSFDCLLFYPKKGRSFLWVLSVIGVDPGCGEMSFLMS